MASLFNIRPMIFVPLVLSAEESDQGYCCSCNATTGRGEGCNGGSECACGSVTGSGAGANYDS
jgi:hypothetical protein